MNQNNCPIIYFLVYKRKISLIYIMQMCIINYSIITQLIFFYIFNILLTFLFINIFVI